MKFTPQYKLKTAQKPQRLSRCYSLLLFSLSLFLILVLFPLFLFLFLHLFAFFLLFFFPLLVGAENPPLASNGILRSLVSNTGPSLFEQALFSLDLDPFHWLVFIHF